MHSESNISTRTEQGEFLARLVHELRAPSNAMSCFLEVFEQATQEAEFTPEAIEAHSIVTRSATELRVLLRSLARYAHANDAKLVEQLDLGQQIQKAWSKAENSKSGELSTSIDGISINGDRFAFAIALQCLFENAILFRSTDRDLHVLATAETKGRALIIRIRDTAMGIPSEYIAQCCAPFGRLHPRKDFPGAGLGIPTAMECIKHMNGTLYLESDGESGTTVTLVFEEPANIPNKA